MKSSIKSVWNPTIVVGLLGVLSAYYFGIVGSAWAVTGEFTRWGAHLMKMAGVDTSQYSYLELIHFEKTPFTRPDGIMIFGMFVGAFIAAILSNNIKLRFPTSKIRVAQALIGGILAGFGARLAMGCNLAAFFTGIPQFSLHTWYFTIASIIGTYIGTKIIKLPIFQSKVKVRKVSKKFKSNQRLNDKNKLSLMIGIAVVLLVLLSIQSFKLGGIFPLLLVFGLIFGFLLEKGQVCFTSAFRDLWTVGRTQMAKAIIIGMALSTIGTFAFIQLGVVQKILWAGPNSLIGGLIFGIGIVIAGGCETGWMYRAVEGQVHYMIVGIGNVIGSILVIVSWDKLAPLLTNETQKINLLSTFGDYGGLTITYIGLMLLFLFVLYYEKRYFAKSKKGI
ncbi:selenium metabolism membrane protein YedE/FdhT [Vagococcus zengguangii]|uniref:selenium metabolism membrane protein YedE/FdhT n=1 Tax=Vagococcus zengguangii TaxID=2571750 RepID=UPI001109D905|nr:selenium metabolism membrane protein YedE/FdhT [Vagococcus zengguangii]TLG81304.1 selenium metabolism membrane protein YedE/FdhT [Vagococcus zengguangii]